MDYQEIKALFLARRLEEVVVVWGINETKNVRLKV